MLNFVMNSYLNKLHLFILTQHRLVLIHVVAFMCVLINLCCVRLNKCSLFSNEHNMMASMKFNPYPTAFPYGNGMVLHFYQQQESSTTKTVHKVINKGLKAYV